MLVGSGQQPRDPSSDWRMAAEQARRDWLYAHQFYENLTDSELIDYAIYMILAAERRYMYILNKIRRFEGYSAEQEKESDKSLLVYYNRV